MKKRFLFWIISMFVVLSSFSQKEQNNNNSKRTIIADFNAHVGPASKVYKECIGAGRANEGLRADWQKQLKTVQDEIGFKYIRMHGLLHDDMGVYTEDKNGNPVYNWQYIDQLYDYLLSVNLKPFVELSFMPIALAEHPDQTVFWWKGVVSKPKSYEKWGQLIKNLVLHFQDRYGFDEVKTWYFEVWNEPDIESFYREDFEEYMQLYETTAKVIKNISKEYRVGGPASAIPYKYEELFLAACTNKNLPVDFIAAHAYGVLSGYFDDSGNRGTIIDPDPQTINKRMKHSRELIQKSAFPNLELHFTEWSSSYTPTDPIHDTYEQASFILDKIKNSQEYVNSMSYWVFTDIFEENGPRTTPFHGGFGLINYQDIKKPAYYAFKFLSEMGNTEVKSTDAASIVTKDDNGNIQALFWDFTIDHPRDSTNDQVFYKLEQPSKPVSPATLFITNLPEGQYLLSEFAVGYLKNDAYSHYIRQGSPAQLDKKQVDVLKELSSGKPDFQKIITVGNNKKFEGNYPMNTNDIRFITLKKL